jgi:hypothetical protein
VKGIRVADTFGLIVGGAVSLVIVSGAAWCIAGIWRSIIGGC